MGLDRSRNVEPATYNVKRLKEKPIPVNTETENTSSSSSIDAITDSEQIVETTANTATDGVAESLVATNRSINSRPLRVVVRRLTEKEIQTISETENTSNSSSNEITATNVIAKDIADFVGENNEGSTADSMTEVLVNLVPISEPDTGNLLDANKTIVSTQMAEIPNIENVQLISTTRESESTSSLNNGINDEAIAEDTTALMENSNEDIASDSVNEDLIDFESICSPTVESAQDLNMTMVQSQNLLPSEVNTQTAVASTLGLENVADRSNSASPSIDNMIVATTSTPSIENPIDSTADTDTSADNIREKETNTLSEDGVFPEIKNEAVIVEPSLNMEEILSVMDVEEVVIIDDDVQFTIGSAGIAMPIQVTSKSMVKRENDVVSGNMPFNESVSKIFFHSLNIA